MHAIVLILVVFLTAQPAADGKPAQPEKVATMSVVVPSEEACHVLGITAVQHAAQDPKVDFATFGCLDVTNKGDTQA